MPGTTVETREMPSPMPATLPMAAGSTRTTTGAISAPCPGRRERLAGLAAEKRVAHVLSGE